MEILHFCLLASDIVWRGRTPYFAVNSNRFEKPYEYEIFKGENEKGEKEYAKIKRKGPSRKIFREHLNELIKEKLFVRIKTNDQRSKYYSITPLGICHLMKDGTFHDGIKCPYPERFDMIKILQSFATPNVKPYKSLIFEGQKFFTYDVFVWNDLAEILQLELRQLIIQVFENFDSYHNRFSYYVYSGISEINKFHLTSFELLDDKVIVNELDKRGDLLYGDPNYTPIELEYEQFHHYLANLMLCSFIYDYSILHYEFELKQANSRKLKPKHDTYDYPDYFQRIIILFTKHISSMMQKRQILMNGFKVDLEQSQFVNRQKQY